MSFEFLEKPTHVETWDRFLAVGLPDKKNEQYRYVRLKELYSYSFSSPQEHETDFTPVEGTLVLVNGSYCESLSRPYPGLIALPLAKAMSTYGTFLKARHSKWQKEEGDPIALLNGAYYQEGLFLYLPPGTVLERPTTIVHLIGNSQQPLHLCPRIILFAGKQSEAQLILKEDSQDSVWVNGFIDSALEESARITWMKKSSLSEKSHHFWAFRSTLKKGSVCKSFSVTNGSATSREDYLVRLMGEGAEASLYGVWNLKGGRQHHVNLCVDHQEPSCTSLQKFKGTLSDHARSSFEGKIYVHQKAQKTQAYQMNNNLILGERALAYSKPNLEIFADDVKASHGATVGQLDQEHLFYLLSRGIPLQQAQNLLLQGFRQEIIDLIPNSSFQKEAAQVIW